MGNGQKIESPHPPAFVACTVPLHLKAHISMVMAMLSRFGTKDAATRRLALWMLWASAGRSSETACCTWDSLEWDPEMSALFVEIYQSKVAKMKLIAIVAGINTLLLHLLVTYMCARAQAHL